MTKCLNLTVTEDKKFLQVVNASKEEVNQLKSAFNKKIKNAWFHPLVKKKLWNGMISFIDNTNRIPVGLWKEVFDVGKKYDYEVNIDNLDTITKDLDEEDFDNWINEFFQGEIKPYDYQIDACKRIIKMGRSVSEIATSGGKTLIMFCVFAYMKSRGLSKRSLIIVPSVSLVEQTYEKFIMYSENRTKINFSVQLLGGGNDKFDKKSDIIIATYQTLRDMPEEFFEGIDSVCCDEAHGTKNISTLKSLKKCTDANFRYGLSGTTQVHSSDADSYTIMGALGPLINKLNADFLFSQKVATPVKIKMLYLDYLDEDIKQQLSELKKNKMDIDPTKLLTLEKKLIISNPKRFEYIIELIKAQTKNTLVLFNNVQDKYGNKIYNKLKEELPNDVDIFYTDGGTDKKQKEYYRKMMDKTDKQRIFVASFGTTSTGIDISNIHAIIFVESFKSEVIIRQSIGRGIRKGLNKEKIVVFDIVDDFCYKKYKNYTYKHSEERIKIYEGENFPYKKFSISL